jgi:hypothetical protein
MKTYYKVCHKNRYGITSINYYDLFHNLTLLYNLNQWTLPKIPNSKLFCFRSLGDARNFVRRNGIDSYAIYECVVKNPHSIKYIGSPHIYTKAINFWKHKDKKYEAPIGTISASSIMLTKLIEEKL